MDTIVLKFGGSSVADDTKLTLVANKIIEFHQNNQVIVVVSAQGKTTDHLLEEALNLDKIPNDRELDVLVSCGEQITISKLAILLNHLGCPAISLTGWQAGIYTNEQNQDAIIQNIDTGRIKKELEDRKVVIVAGFQGINQKGDITTLGRGGSDTTAIALAAAIKAKDCYIFSDVDGVFTSDPNRIRNARKLENLSYVEMTDMANEGAKVLHNRSVEIAQKFQIPILARSTFKEGTGTIIGDTIEDISIKSIVKNDDIILTKVFSDNIIDINVNELLLKLLNANIGVNHYTNMSEQKLDICFVIKKSDINKLKSVLDEIPTIHYQTKPISRISIIGNGITSNNTLEKVLSILETNTTDILKIENSETRLSLTFNLLISDEIANQLHDKVI